MDTPDTFDELFEDEPLSEFDLLRLERQSADSALSELEAALLEKLDRLRYYTETITQEDLERWIKHVHQIRRDYFG